MRFPVRLICLVLVFLHALAGCGGDDPPARAVLSVCGLACAGAGAPDLAIGLKDQGSCVDDFVVFEQDHPDKVCGYAWERVPTSGCIGTLIVGSVFSIVCTLLCQERPDLQLCVLECLAEELGLKGNCVVCMLGESLSLQACLRQPSPTPEGVSACLQSYILTSAGCSP